MGIDVRHLTGDERAAYLRDMTLALTDELHEALQESGWKPWQTSRHLNADAYGMELVDAFHFLVNLWLAIGWTADDVERAYFEKAQKNARRQTEGYTGLDKCTTCGREQD